VLLANELEEMKLIHSGKSYLYFLRESNSIMRYSIPDEEWFFICKFVEWKEWLKDIIKNDK